MGSTVLVVEDDASLLRLVSFALRSWGHSTVLSSDAEAALQRLSDDIQDVILCDVNLPGMHGPEFTELVKSSPSLGDTPVILMSAYDEPQDHAADLFISKPFDPMEVVQLVEQFLSDGKYAGEAQDNNSVRLALNQRQVIPGRADS